MKPPRQMMTVFVISSVFLLFSLPFHANGQAVTPDSLGNPVDSLAREGKKPIADTAQAADLRSSRTAMLLSLFIPGAGQVYNESYWKAGIITAAEVTLASLAVREHLLLTNISTQLPSSVPDSIREDLITGYRDRRNAFAFLAGVAIIYSISDAYVDAHMFHFREQQTLSVVPSDRGLGFSAKLNF